MPDSRGLVPAIPETDTRCLPNEIAGTRLDEPGDDGRTASTIAPATMGRAVVEAALFYQHLPSFTSTFHGHHMGSHADRQVVVGARTPEVLSPQMMTVPMPVKCAASALP